MASVKEKTIVEVKDCQIIGVEPGNVNKVSVEDSVVAFTLKAGEGLVKRYKVLAKGKQAFTLYNLFLANGKTISKELEEEGVKKVVTVSLIAFKREERPFEIVLQDPTDIEFNFNYKVK